MSTSNKISIFIFVAFLAVMCFMAGVYTPWNIALFKAVFIDTPEPIRIETFTSVPTRKPTSGPNATFTTMPSPTRYQSPTPAPTRTPTTKKVNATLEPIIVVSTPPAKDVQPAPRCFVLVLDDSYWRVVADDLNACKDELIMVEGDPVFDAVNTWDGLTITKVTEELYGKYPLGQTIYVENAGMNIIYAETKVYFQGLVDWERSSVRVDNQNELSFSVVTKWGSAQGIINRDGTIKIKSQAGQPTPTATATATPTMTPTKVPTRAAPKPVSAKIGDEWHTFSYIIIAPTYVYSSPSLKDSSATYLSYGRYVKPTAKWVNDQGTVFVFVHALNEKNEYYVSGWIPATAVKSLLPNPAEIPIVQISNE